MKRLIDQYLKRWKESDSRKSLILKGAHQVGKTFSARELGKSYRDFYEINFEKRTDLQIVFERNFDPIRILRDLSVDRGKEITPGETLLFLTKFKHVPRRFKSPVFL